MGQQKPPDQGGQQQPQQGGQQKPPQAGGNQNMSKDVDDALDALRAEERTRYDAEIARVKRNAKIDNYALKLTSKTGTSEVLVRKKLNSFQSEEAMDLYVKESLKKQDDDVKLGIEREHGDRPDLKEEWENYKSLYKSDIDFDTYVRLGENMNKPKDFGNKVVHTVRDAGGHFA
jgi:hypothetical protein